MAAGPHPRRDLTLMPRLGFDLSSARHGRGRCCHVPVLRIRFRPFSPLREVERQALERDGQVDALQLHVRRHLQRPGREVQHRLDAGRDHQIDDVLRRRGGHGDDGDADAVAARELLQVVDVVDRHAAARLLADLLAQVVEQRADFEPFLAEPGIVGEREARGCRRR